MYVVNVAVLLYWSRKFTNVADVCCTYAFDSPTFCVIHKTLQISNTLFYVVENV